ncbi:hypothetical protein JXJ21_24105 [candidate division KSB1 bacterium]|nr:hypothetical protein [candidate division KSB1 bacterium]
MSRLEIHQIFCVQKNKKRDQAMQLSIHYYVLKLSKQASRLYEGFREKLIDIQNAKFPIESSPDSRTSLKPLAQETQLRKFLNLTDQHFTHYFEQDPLRLVVVGEKEYLSIFEELTIHREAMIGTIKGDYAATSTHDLGKIVWPAVKEAISGTTENALRDLAEAARMNKMVSGIDAVGQSAATNPGSTLYVEDDYHVKGSVNKTDHSLVFSKYVNLVDVLDDIVDIIIENVLEMGGNVIFLKNGSLISHERIALVLRG